MQHTPGPWRYEPETQTIRSIPSNHWLATMDSFDGAVSNEANARLIAASPELLAALTIIKTWLIAPDTSTETLDEMTTIVRAAIAKAVQS